MWRGGLSFGSLAASRQFALMGLKGKHASSAPAAAGSGSGAGAGVGAGGAPEEGDCMHACVQTSVWVHARVHARMFVCDRARGYACKQLLYAPGWRHLR